MFAMKPAVWMPDSLFAVFLVCLAVFGSGPGAVGGCLDAM